MMGLSRKGASTTSQVLQKAATKSFSGKPGTKGIIYKALGLLPWELLIVLVSC
jgi:hypothetical protein